jgi:hypothetical protein
MFGFKAQLDQYSDGITGRFSVPRESELTVLSLRFPEKCVSGADGTQPRLLDVI